MKIRNVVRFAVLLATLGSSAVHAADVWVASETVSNCGIDLRNSPNSPQPNFSYVWITNPTGYIYRYYFDRNNDVEVKRAQSILSIALTAKTTGSTVGINHETGYIDQIQLN